MTPPLVAVFGSGSAPLADLERARALGRALAEAGYGVINGGYGGTMEASAEGARASGGSAIGVTCSLFDAFRSGPNPYASEIVEAPTLYARLETMIERASAYVVLPGGVGTLIELALTWEHLRRGLVPERPLIVWKEPWRAVVEVLERSPYAETGHELLTWVSDVDQAVAAIRERVASNS